MRSPLTRRQFVTRSSLIVGSLVASRSKGASFNEEIGVAVVGLGNKGKSLIGDVGRTQGARLMAICDPDSDRLREKAEFVSDEFGFKVKTYTNFRDVLDSKEVDAVVLSSPNHWHALQTIWACQAGKDVYVEKPVCHTPWEGRQMLRAASKYQRIVQSGLQGRSDTGMKKAIQWIHEGNLGEIQSVRAIVYDNRTSIGKLQHPLVPPPACDFDLWLGPAEDRPIYRPELHYDWHWDWNTGNGDTGNQGVHELDLARWVLGDPDHPEAVFSLGGRFAWNDAGNTPNMQNASFDWSGKPPVLLEMRDMWINPSTNAAGNYKGRRFGIIVSCAGGEFQGGRGGGIVYDETGARRQRFDGDGGFDHFPAFIRAVRSRKESDTGCTLLNGYLSSCLCHQANISLRVGGMVSPSEAIDAVSENPLMRESTRSMKAHLDAWDIDFEKEPWTLGERLALDHQTERFIGGSSAKIANRLLRREYRKGYVVPQKI